jgi:hypothetical protein
MEINLLKMDDNVFQYFCLLLILLFINYIIL